MDVQDYGRLIRRKREQQEVTLELFARVTGVDIEDLALIEAGEADPPLSLALRLASGLGWIIR